MLSGTFSRGQDDAHGGSYTVAWLELRDRAQAVILAYETGLVTPGDEMDSVTRPHA
jgi:hypothetical protein